ncbi:MAG TPA: type II toxin-antitoxin system VapC family toxin [Longilinea sp.]|nr:type II toxin-antitoxin system VapC family toxin [Longilinea sp.]
MPHRPKAIVLDSWSIIAYLDDEPSGRKIADLIADANEQEIPIYMSVVNAGEVWYIIAREISEKDADDSVKQLHQLRIQLKDADWDLTQEAARFKSQHKMSYADCFAGALAKTMKADLVTGDKEFKAIEDAVTIQWV